VPAVEALYRRHLEQVEHVQGEQAALLRRLARGHGLRRVYAEGLTKEGAGAYKDKALALAAVGRDDLSGLREQQREARELALTLVAAGKAGTVGHKKAKAIEAEAAALSRSNWFCSSSWLYCSHPLLSPGALRFRRSS
jgi:hypothetical protein